MDTMQKSDWENMAKTYAGKRLKTEPSEGDETKNKVEPSIEESFEEDIAAKSMKHEDIEIEQLKQEAMQNPYDYYGWESLVKTLNGMKNRESELLEAYESFLNEFPLLYGYWKRYAEALGKKEGFEAGKAVYRRGLRYLSHNPEMWVNFLQYCFTASGLSTSEKRQLVDEAVESCGLHWLSWKVWQIALELEEEVLRSGSNNSNEGEDCMKETSESIQRLRKIYNESMRTVMRDGNEVWKKFKSLVGGVNEGDALPLPITIVEMMNESELYKLDVKIHDSLQKSENSNFNIEAFENRISQLKAAELKNYEVDKTFSPEEGDLKIRTTSGTSIVVHKSSMPDEEQFTIHDLIQQIAVRYDGSEYNRNHKSDKSQWRLAVDDQLMMDDKSVLAKDVPLKDSKLTLFEGFDAVKSMVEAMAGRFAAEQWCLDIRKSQLKDVEEKYKQKQVFEEKCTRWFHHPAPLKPEQLSGWREYLDYEEEFGTPESINFLYKRCLEVCINYVEFVNRRVAVFEKQERWDEILEFYSYICNDLCKRRPDMHLEFAEVAERCNRFKEAEALYDKLTDPKSGMNCNKMLDVWLRQIAYYKRRKDTQKCIELYNKAKCAITDAQKLIVLVMDEAKFYLRQPDGQHKAIELLKEQMESHRTNIALFKFYVDVLEHHSASIDETYIEIKRLFECMLNEEKIIVTAKWELWRSFVEFLRVNATNVNEYTTAKRRAQEFLYVNRSELLNVSEKNEGRREPTVNQHMEDNEASKKMEGGGSMHYNLWIGGICKVQKIGGSDRVISDEERCTQFPTMMHTKDLKRKGEQRGFNGDLYLEASGVGLENEMSCGDELNSSKLASNETEESIIGESERARLQTGSIKDECRVLPLSKVFNDRISASMGGRQYCVDYGYEAFQKCVQKAEKIIENWMLRTEKRHFSSAYLNPKNRHFTAAENSPLQGNDSNWSLETKVLKGLQVLGKTMLDLTEMKRLIFQFCTVFDINLQNAYLSVSVLDEIIYTCYKYDDCPTQGPPSLQNERRSKKDDYTMLISLTALSISIASKVLEIVPKYRLMNIKTELFKLFHPTGERKGVVQSESVYTSSNSGSGSDELPEVDEGETEQHYGYRSSDPFYRFENKIMPRLDTHFLHAPTSSFYLSWILTILQLKDEAIEQEEEELPEEKCGNSKVKVDEFSPCENSRTDRESTSVHPPEELCWNDLQISHPVTQMLANRRNCRCSEDGSSMPSSSASNSSTSCETMTHLKRQTNEVPPVLKAAPQKTYSVKNEAFIGNAESAASYASYNKDPVKARKAYNPEIVPFMLQALVCSPFYERMDLPNLCLAVIVVKFMLRICFFNNQVEDFLDLCTGESVAQIANKHIWIPFSYVLVQHSPLDTLHKSKLMSRRHMHLLKELKERVDAYLAAR